MTVAANFQKIRESIASACLDVNRNPNDVQLLAVSKLQSIELIEEAYACGQRHFGENYVQELLEKRARLSHLRDVSWHLIGHLQSNKAKIAVANADYFQALDSVKLARELSRRVGETTPGKRLPVFIQVKVDSEETKSGVDPGDIGLLVRAVDQEAGLKLHGLMCIPESRPNPEEMRPAFQVLSRLAKNIGRPLQLSMGMSEDFEVAIQEGAHWIRVGRKLFGERPQAR
jgi:pyridoxal phosphate enzyme (YggS family)